MVAVKALAGDDGHAEKLVGLLLIAEIVDILDMSCCTMSKYFSTSGKSYNLP